MPKKYVVELTPEERKTLIAVVSKGRNKALVIRRAHILLKSDEGKTDIEIAGMFYIDPDTVHRVRKSYCQLGLSETLAGKAYPEQEPLLDEKQEAHLVALACSEPPQGFARWTLVMLAKQLVEDDVVESISPESVRLVLKKNKLKPWRVKSWCIPKVTLLFLQQMEHILELYQQAYNPRRPLVCFDEKSVQLLAHSREPMAPQPGKARRQDYEYKRHGTRNLFVFVEPKAGQRHVLITKRRKKRDFALAMRYLVDILYPEADLIDVVLDNLNTHHYHSLVEFFGKTEADRIMARLQFHFTPPHASWLNMAEIELSVMSEQCLSRRLSDEWTLAMELLTWEQISNDLARKINWSFTVADAKRVFDEYYSAFLGC